MNITQLGSNTPPTLREATRFWFALGWLSFGGPAGQIALMHRELVDNKGWIDDAHFAHALNYCMLLPGPEAQQLATYLGWLMHGKRGGIIAGLLFILPAVFVLFVLSWLYVSHSQQPWMMGVFYGLKPAVAALVVLASIRVAKRNLKHSWMRALSLLAFVALAVFNLPFPWIIAAAAIAGVALQHWRAKQAFNSANSIAAASATEYQTAKPRPHWKNLVQVGLVGFTCWLLPFSLLWWQFGWDQGFTQMAWFFTTAALLCFGGAYAVLPYVIQGAVQHYHWLTPGQMLDGLALGESTPGPLIMVINFVAFLGAYQQAFLGPDANLSAALVASLLVTWFSFLPSFVFILAGAPLVESTRHNQRWQVPLSAITAAVVGVIANLALFFIYHCLWPHGVTDTSWQGFLSTLDVQALGLFVLALALFAKGRTGLLGSLGICALLGFGLQYLT